MSVGSTITEKIIAAHAGVDRVTPGDLVTARVDLTLSTDVGFPLTARQLEGAGVKKMWDRDRIALTPGRYTPNKDVKTAEQAALMRRFAREHEITYYYEIGELGIDPVFLPEQGLVGPGDLIAGNNSHTCTMGAVGAFATGMGSTDVAAIMALGETWLLVPESIKIEYSGKLGPFVTSKDLILWTIGKTGVAGADYRAIEFTGELVSGLCMDERMTLCNMAMEAGAKNGIVPPDDVTLDYVRGRAKRPYICYASDPDAEYSQVLTLDATGLGPTVSRPHSPANAVPVEEVAGVQLDQVFIGSCTNGKLTDLARAASILKGKRIAKGLRVIVTPATPWVYLEAVRAGIVEDMVAAGATFTMPTCGACAGLHTGVLAGGEVCLSTTNRNFVGRMGHPESQVYLASPYVAAASALTGVITDPREVARDAAR